MGKKHRNLYNDIIDKDNLWAAYRRASKNKKSSTGYLLFNQYEAHNINLISEALKCATYLPSDPVLFNVYEPKERCISALPFSDRVVQHSLHYVLNRIFDPIFHPNSYACRSNKGTHAGVKRVQSIIRKHENLWCLKLDFKSYFKSIDRGILYIEIDKKIKCLKTLNLLSLFHPRIGKGIPIGNLTSQLLANIYGNIIDRYMVHTLKLKNWVRYMDDIVIFGNRQELKVVFEKLTLFAKDHMSLTWSKWSLKPVSQGINFLGYRIWKNYKLIRTDSVRRAKRKIIKYSNNAEKLKKFKGSWMGHIQWANCHNLKTKLLGDL